MKKIFINGIFIVLLIELYLAKGNESMIQIKVPIHMVHQKHIIKSILIMIIIQMIIVKKMI